MAERAERDLAGRCGARQPLNGHAAVPLSKSVDGVPSEHCFANSGRAGKYCAQPVLAFQRRLQKAQRLPARDRAPFNGHSRILRRPRRFLPAYEQTVVDIASAGWPAAPKTGSGLLVIFSVGRPYSAGAEQTP